ncbi:MAG: exodeoxyribonuclease III [Beijerinckiaceae bacterium]|nr:exodeoxyribonuclease III [Beijerinckiaceae bacterium]
MRIATWNVNSIRQRAGHIVDWLRETQPDIVALQELKCVDEAFPGEEIEALGYNIAVHGQKGFNGVALLSKYPLDEVRRGLPESPADGEEPDLQSRYIEAVISLESGVIRVASIYLPNGNPVDTPKYPYKIAWMDRLIAHARNLLALEEPLILAGDYNVIPEPRDCYDPKVWANDALFLPQTRAKFRELLALGLTEAFRATNDEDGQYTFWDYQAGAWSRNLGLRIDHLLLSPEAADRLVSVTIDKMEREREKPSDHVPVRLDLRG